MQSSSRGGASVRLVAIHTTEGIMRAADLRAWAKWPGSSHAANDETGVLLDGAADGFVDYARSAWTLRSGNPISDNLEQCAWSRWSRAEWLSRPRLLESTAQWIARRCTARKIPAVRLTLAQIRAGHFGVIAHWDWTVAMGDGTHTDVGKNFPWDVVLGRALQIIAGASPGSITTEGFMAGLNDTQQQDAYNAIIRQLGGEALPVAVGNDLVGGPVTALTGAPQQTRAVQADIFATGRANQARLEQVDRKLDMVLAALKVKQPAQAPMQVTSERVVELAGTVLPVEGPLANAEVLEEETSARIAELRAIAEEDAAQHPEQL